MSKAELSLIHEIMPPRQQNEKAPLLLMLHGYGSHERDLFSMASMLNEKFYIVSVRAPLNLGWGGFAWYELDLSQERSKMSNIVQAKESLEKLNKLIDEIVDVYPVDEDNVWLMGFSQGCILSYGLSLNNPEKFRGVLALSGYILKDIVPEKYNPSELRKLDFFVSHGTQDEVLPVQWARKSIEVLEQLKISHQYGEYPMGHGISPQCFDDMKKWLKERGML